MMTKSVNACAKPNSNEYAKYLYDKIGGKNLKCLKLKLFKKNNVKKGTKPVIARL